MIQLTRLYLKGFDSKFWIPAADIRQIDTEVRHNKESNVIEEIATRIITSTGEHHVKETALEVAMMLNNNDQ